jgi:hypothetical protein
MFLPRARQIGLTNEIEGVLRIGASKMGVEERSLLIAVSKGPILWVPIHRSSEFPNKDVQVSLHHNKEVIMLYLYLKTRV